MQLFSSGIKIADNYLLSKYFMLAGYSARIVIPDFLGLSWRRCQFAPCLTINKKHGSLVIPKRSTTNKNCEGIAMVKQTSTVKSFVQATVAASLLSCGFAVDAATVYINPVTTNVQVGTPFDVEIRGTEFPATTGGGVQLSWNSDLITLLGGTGPATDAGVDIADTGDSPAGVWDDPDISPFSDRGAHNINGSMGELNNLFVGTSSFFTGVTTGDFLIATLHFEANDVVDSAVLITAAGTPWGIPLVSDQIDVTFENGTVNISGAAAVPVPAAVWLFGSGLLGLVGIARRRATA
jgi:hypothetical protein